MVEWLLLTSHSSYFFLDMYFICSIKLLFLLNLFFCIFSTTYAKVNHTVICKGSLAQSKYIDFMRSFVYFPVINHHLTVLSSVPEKLYPFQT